MYPGVSFTHEGYRQLERVLRWAHVLRQHKSDLPAARRRRVADQARMPVLTCARAL